MDYNLSAIDQSKTSDKGGFSLIEVLVAMTVLSLVFVTISVLLTKSLSMTQHADDRTRAANLLQDINEYYRFQRDQASSWEEFVTVACEGVVATPTPNPVYNDFDYTIAYSGPSGDCSESVAIETDISWENDRYHLNSNTLLSKWD